MMSLVGPDGIATGNEQIDNRCLGDGFTQLGHDDGNGRHGLQSEQPPCGSRNAARGRAMGGPEIRVIGHWGVLGIQALGRRIR